MKNFRFLLFYFFCIAKTKYIELLSYINLLKDFFSIRKEEFLRVQTLSRL